MSDYMFSDRARRRRPIKVRDCKYDGLPCEYCPRGCIYERKLKLLESKAHGQVNLNLRKALFESVRFMARQRRAQTPLR